MTTARAKRAPPASRLPPGMTQRAPLPNDIASWVPLLNNYFAGYAEILATLANIKLRDSGPYQPTRELALLAEKQRTILSMERRDNDTHAILEGEPDWNVDPLLLRYVTMDFATVRALRKANKPAVLSGNSVVVNPAHRIIYLHLRSIKYVDTYNDALHTFGGAFIPHDPAVLRDSDKDLRATIYRELSEESKIGKEESKIRLCRDNTTPIMMVRETTTGFIQGVLLGVKAEGTDGERYVTVEGEVVYVPFDALPAALLGEDRRWVPSGKLHVLAWLAAGTPPCPGAQFRKYSADALLMAALSQAPRHLPP